MISEMRVHRDMEHVFVEDLFAALAIRRLITSSPRGHSGYASFQRLVEELQLVREAVARFRQLCTIAQPTSLVQADHRSRTICNVHALVDSMPSPDACICRKFVLV
jgi:hypothetical protein